MTIEKQSHGHHQTLGQILGQALGQTLGLALSIVLALGAALSPATAWAESPVTSQYSAYSEDETRTIDHSVWGQFLAIYLSNGSDGINRFDYSAVSDADRAVLESYIEGQTALRPTEFSRNEQISYWVNLYNALTVKVVLDHYPVRSIRRIKYGRILASGPWGHDLVTIEGTDLNLMDIENRILRPVFDEPRIHYAINCASIGCPNLAAAPFMADQLEAQLDAAARAYINHPRGAHVVSGRLTVSSIYVWFKDDFGGNDRQVIAHLRQYADADLTAELEGITRISRHGYDWDLNEPESGP